MKQYLSNWNFMRLLRLAAGIFIIIQGANMQEWLLVAAGVIFTLMPIFNLGCCSTSACNINIQKPGNKKEDIGFEEVKQP